MKWLTLTLIKQQIRMESSFTDEDDILTMYGNSAEEMVLDVINRDYTEVIERWGEVPKPLVHASLLIVAQSYQHREPQTVQNLYAVHNSFDMMVKPYMRLASDNYEQNNTQGCGNKCTNL